MPVNKMKLRTIQTIAGLLFAFVFLAIALYRVPLADVRPHLPVSSHDWLVAAMLTVTSLIFRSAPGEWQIILRPVAPNPILDNSQGSVSRIWNEYNYAGASRRAVRAQFVKNTSGLSRIWGLTSIVIERLFDGFAVVTCLGIGLLTAKISKDADILIEVFHGWRRFLRSWNARCRLLGRTRVLPRPL